MFFHFFAFLLVYLVSASSSNPPADSRTVGGFLVGIFGDENRSITCVTGSSGTIFEQVAWAYVPNELGLAYITMRFDFPANVDLSARPAFNDLVNDVIFTEFADGTAEWNLLFEGCPSGWVKVFSQECVLLDDLPSQIRILGDRSMVRDCTFVLNGVEVVNELLLNDPDCPIVPKATPTWGHMKSVYR